MNSTINSILPSSENPSLELPPRLPYKTLQEYYAARYSDSCLYHRGDEVQPDEKKYDYDPFNYTYIVDFLDQHQQGVQLPPDTDLIINRLNLLIDNDLPPNSDADKIKLRAKEMKFEYYLMTGRDGGAFYYLRTELRNAGSEYARFYSVENIQSAVLSLLTREPSLNGHADIVTQKNLDMNSAILLLNTNIGIFREKERQNNLSYIYDEETNREIDKRVTKIEIPDTNLQAMIRLATEGLSPIQIDTESGLYPEFSSTEDLGAQTIQDIINTISWVDSVLEDETIEALDKAAVLKIFKQVVELSIARTTLLNDAAHYFKTVKSSDKKVSQKREQIGNSLKRKYDRFFKLVSDVRVFKEVLQYQNIDIDFVNVFHSVLNTLPSQEQSSRRIGFLRGIISEREDSVL